MNREIKITFITPCFCRGADCSETGAPEIRPASIRGQLHWWFRALGGTPQEENTLFGSVHEKDEKGKTQAKASKVVIRVRYPLQPQTKSAATLPHKSGGMAALKNAIAPGVSFDLLVSTRLGGLSPDLEAKFNRALEAWLLLGALGLRATRGGGNFSYEDQPATPEDYTTAISSVSGVRAAILDKNHSTAETARKAITDTLASDAFNNAPLGRIKPSRKTSPLRFRIIQLSLSDFLIIAIWDTRTAVTGNTDTDLHAAIDKLALQGKFIGLQLQQSPLRPHT
jgi:CRISPR/Cas system CMR-associated protein Cmr1 (group 7 of RAMP superfamily)